MGKSTNGRVKGVLERIARRVMQERGFLPDFSKVVMDELESIQKDGRQGRPPPRDLRHLLWASIGNDDSLDLDQLTVAEVLPDQRIKIYVAVADVDFLVKKHFPIDLHAQQNTTSVYTAGKTFPMLPEKVSEEAPGHFGLAVMDYTHSTAPNRRFPDLITHRILKAAMDKAAEPYSREELLELARHCTLKEDEANKVERLVAKSAAAMLLTSRIGEQFEAVCTGAAEKGTWVRIFHPPIEGRLLYGYEGVDVGNRVRVQLIHTDIERGYIDFKKVHPRP